MTYINNLLWATRDKFGKQNKAKLNLQFAQQTRVKSKGNWRSKNKKNKTPKEFIYIIEKNIH